jgi:hypothetical protein
VPPFFDDIFDVGYFRSFEGFYASVAGPKVNKKYDAYKIEQGGND